MPKQLPLIKIGLLSPMVQALKKRGLDPESVLESVGLSEGLVRDGQASTHVMVLHQFFENCAKAAMDDHFGALVSSEISLEVDPIWREALEAGDTPADVLSFYVSHSHRWCSSAIPFLEAREERAAFGESRSSIPVMPPRQNDAFMASNALSILSKLIGDNFKPEMVVVITCDTSAFPPEFSQYQMLRGNNMGYRIQFPSEWLHLRIRDGIAQIKKQSDAKVDLSGISFLDSFRLLLSQNIGNGGLTANEAASLTSMHPSKLSRRLAKRKTSIGQEIQLAKHQFAAEKLANTDISIEEISSLVGYSDPANFARAFKRMAGCSPREFRKQAKEGTRHRGPQAVPTNGAMLPQRMG